MSVSRREFLKASGGLVIAFSLFPEVVSSQQPTRLPGSLNANRMLNSWLRIDPDGSVTIFTGKIELGQGIGTAITQIAAGEAKRAGVGHRAASAILLAASLIAFITRG